MEFRARPAAGLSHGEKRYLEIVMTLATDPKILLLDGPTAGMSPVETFEATDLIRDVRDKLDLTHLHAFPALKSKIGVFFITAPNNFNRLRCR